MPGLTAKVHEPQMTSCDFSVHTVRRLGYFDIRVDQKLIDMDSVYDLAKKAWPGIPENGGGLEPSCPRPGVIRFTKIV